MKDILFYIEIGLAIVALVIFSVEVQKLLLAIFSKISRIIGSRVKSSEITVQRYIFTHTDSWVAKSYNWINEQVIALGLKKFNVTPLGFFTFWGLVSIPIAIVINNILDSGALFSVIMYVVVLFMFLFITKMRTASNIESREDMIMTSIDMLIPDIKSGVENCIVKYIDVLPQELRRDYQAFINRRVRQGYTFKDSIIILADNIGGTVFRDFAQKAIFYEETGEAKSVDLFIDIVETNRIRRDLRYTNRLAFDALKSDLLLASAVIWLYVFLVGFREEFTLNFMLNTNFGKTLFILDIVIEIAAVGFITTIRAKDI